MGAQVGMEKAHTFKLDPLKIDVKETSNFRLIFYCVAGALIVLFCLCLVIYWWRDKDRVREKHKSPMSYIKRASESVEESAISECSLLSSDFKYKYRMPQTPQSEIELRISVDAELAESRSSNRVLDFTFEYGSQKSVPVGEV